jgi:hypothetical protein
MKPIVALLSAMCALLIGAAHAEPRATVCTLAAEPGKFVAKRVEIVGAEIFHNGVDISILVDEMCPGSLVRLKWTSDASKLQELAELRSALFQRGEFGTMGKRITGNFTGLVQLDRFEDDHVAALVLESVTNLHVVMDK